MHKSLIALVGAAGIGLAALAAPATQTHGCFGCAVGAGILGGVVAGAIVGSAIANSPPPGYYPPPPPPGYYPPPPPPGAYYPPPPGAYPPPAAYAQLAPGCHWGHARSGSRVTAISGGPCKSAPDGGAEPNARRPACEAGRFVFCHVGMHYCMRRPPLAAVVALPPTAGTTRTRTMGDLIVRSLSVRRQARIGDAGFAAAQPSAPTQRGRSLCADGRRQRVAARLWPWPGARWLPWR